MGIREEDILAVSKIQSENKIVLPKKVRVYLNVKPGDYIIWRLCGRDVLVCKLK